jgi:hypothetical protein
MSVFSLPAFVNDNMDIRYKLSFRLVRHDKAMKLVILMNVARIVKVNKYLRAFAPRIIDMFKDLTHRFRVNHS